MVDLCQVWEYEAEFMTGALQAKCPNGRGLARKTDQYRLLLGDFGKRLKGSIRNPSHSLVEGFSRHDT